MMIHPIVLGLGLHTKTQRMDHVSLVRNKPRDYKEKDLNLKDLDDDLDRTFISSEETDDQQQYVSNSGSMIIRNMENAAEGGDEDKKEMIKEIEELKFRLGIEEQDLTE
eukprot:18797_1